MTTEERNKQLDAIDPAIIWTRRFLLVTTPGSEAGAYADIALESLSKALAVLRHTDVTDAKPARPTDAEYLEYRPDGAGHDAPNMPF